MIVNWNIKIRSPTLTESKHLQAEMMLCVTIELQTGNE